ncbi:Antibiotic biosynthesis monooxygenase (fragment) [Paraburkholderia ribeironis]|uniref:Antibiotic biosynthesis monooxygenase n=1 Tax=Paraburkholderia ribeironis TaxID=1247936 RepID=A0A1N7SR14_9BURK
MILLTAWRDKQAADSYANTLTLPDGARLRSVRVIRDYGMHDRREAPQYYPDAPQPE